LRGVAEIARLQPEIIGLLTNSATAIRNLVMNWLAENTLPIWMAGAVALTMALIVFAQTRTRGAFIGILAVIGITAALLMTSWLIVTPREAVERALYDLAATVEANDVAGALNYLAPTASKELREDVQTLMPQVRIERARVIGAPQTEMNASADAATVQCRGIIVAVNKQDGMKGGADDRLTLQWVRRGDRWLLERYASQKDWNSAVGRPKRGGAQSSP
jgi:hypothetical protein